MAKAKPTIEIAGTSYPLSLGFRCTRYFEEIHGIPLSQVNKGIVSYVRYMHSAIVAGGTDISFDELSDQLDQDKRDYTVIVREFDEMVAAHADKKKE